MSVPLLLLVSLVSSSVCVETQPPPTPAWPDQFTVRFAVLLEQYGPTWNSSGVLYYDWKMKVGPVRGWPGACACDCPIIARV